MAWNIHWQSIFTSYNGTHYAVNIYEQDYSGSVVQLTAAAEPFVTQEEDDDNIYTAIRPQTGYLRVIDTDGTLIESILPNTNTEKMVRLVTGSVVDYNGVITFTQDSGNESIKWQGFLCAEAFTQPWDGNVKVLELPVKSLLASLSDAIIPSDNAYGNVNIAKMIVDALSSTNLTVDYVTIISDMNGSQADMLKVIIRLESLFDEQEICEESYSYNSLIGMSYSDILTGILSLYGLQARESGTKIIFAQYDCPDTVTLNVEQYSWGSINNIATGSTGTVDSSEIVTSNIIDTFTFAGADNDATFIPGATAVSVELPVKPYESTFIKLPKTDEDNSSYDLVRCVSAIIAVQEHQPRVNDVEIFNYYKYTYRYNQNNDKYSYEEVAGTFGYSDCLNDTLMKNYNKMKEYPTVSQSIVTGAFPCRWYALLNAAANVRLINGLFLVNLWKGKSNENLPDTPHLAYSIASEGQVDINDGYIVLDMDCHNFYRTFFYNPEYPEFSSNEISWEKELGTTGDHYYKVLMQIRVGNKYWNGHSWTDTESNVYVGFNGSNIVTLNMSSYITDKKGLILPINSELSGNVIISIFDYVDGTTYGLGDLTWWAFNRIIGNITLTHYLASSARSSDRSKNVYRRQIIPSGFSGEEKINLNWGTFNNNITSTVFLKNANGEYIEAIHFKTGTIEESTERPEMHLLDRLSNHYQTIKRTFTGTVQTGHEIIIKKFTYLSRKFLAIDAQHNWREDRQSVKFIEL